jgi:hypothetical protein
LTVIIKISLLRKVTVGTQKFYVIAPDIIVVDIHKGNILSNLRLAMQYIHRYNAFNKNIYFKAQPDFLDTNMLNCDHISILDSNLL